MIKIKGHEFHISPVRDSHNRRSMQIANKIMDTLKKLDLTEDDYDVPLEPMAMKKTPASVSWYFEGYNLHYTYALGGSFADNLNMVYHVLDREVSMLLEKERTVDEFIREFSEDKDVKEQRKEAREILGLAEDVMDITIIDKKFKEMAKDLHPDMPTGDHEKFKAINRAHKILRRELM